MNWWTDTRIDYFKRPVGTPTGAMTMFIPQKQVDMVVSSLLENADLLNSLKQYLQGLERPETMTKDAEIRFRQLIHPCIDEELRKIDPRFQIFTHGILLRLFAKLED